MLDYRARYYDPRLGRFISADTVVPEPGNPQALNRYSYALNRPLQGGDPTGHTGPVPRCPICTLEIDISNWPKVGKDLALVASLVTDLHVDLEQGLITGPTEQEWIESSLTDMVNPIGMAAAPLRRGLSKIGKEATEEVTQEIGERAWRGPLKNLPTQRHHLVTNKHPSKWTPIFEELADKYKLDLDEAWNKVEIPHQGRHPEEYHKWVWSEIRKIDRIAQGKREEFLKLFEENIKKPVMEHPEMLIKEWWE